MTIRVRHTGPPNLNGCRWCGIDQRDHMQRWKPPVGWHQHEAPTPAQIKARMLARRAARTTTKES
jgi:hypothetical protein